MEFSLGQLVRLVPKSKRGRERVRRFGHVWIVTRTASMGQAWRGLAIAVRSVAMPEGSDRWVLLDADPDFTLDGTVGADEIEILSRNFQESQRKA